MQKFKILQYPLYAVLATAVRTRKEKRKTWPKIVAYGCFDKVCTAPLGPKFPLAPMRVLAQTSPPTPQKTYQKFQNCTTSFSRIFLKLGQFPVKIGLIWGVWGVPEIFFWLESSHLCYLGAHAKICNPMMSFSAKIQNRMISLPGIYLKLAHFPVKIKLIGEVGGVPQICLWWESSNLRYLRAHAKKFNPMMRLSGIYL